MTVTDKIAAAERLLIDHASGRKVYVDDAMRSLRQIVDLADWVRAQNRRTMQ